MGVFSKKPKTVLLLLYLLLVTTMAAAVLTPQELDAALFALRSNGYTLFPNAIATSDLHIRMLTSHTSYFTLFSPPDSLLFSLDLHSSASLYIFSLLLHVSPQFLSTSDLIALPSPFLETLLPTRQLFVEHTVITHNRTYLPSVTLDGVRVSNPDLFLGSNIAVHGLDGILVSRYKVTADDDLSGEIRPAIAPISWCESCVSPATSPEISPPALAPDFVDLRPGVNVSRHGAFFRIKHLFNG